MAKRRYMHGKRRRKSSCAPFKKHKPGHVEPPETVLSDEQVTGLADYLAGLEGGVRKPEASESNTLLDAVRGVGSEDINPSSTGEEMNALGEISPVGSQAKIFGGPSLDTSQVTSAYSPAQLEAYHGLSDKERAK